MRDGSTNFPRFIAARFLQIRYPLAFGFMFAPKLRCHRSRCGPPSAASAVARSTGRSISPPCMRLKMTFTIRLTCLGAPVSSLSAGAGRCRTYKTPSRMLQPRG